LRFASYVLGAKDYSYTNLELV